MIKLVIASLVGKAPSAAAVDLGDLDEGETDCIRIALSEGAAQVLLLLDERAGRAIAQELGIQVAGTAAVIGLAKKRGLITSARARFERLHGSDFRISAAVIQAVLRGEANFEGLVELALAGAGLSPACRAFTPGGRRSVCPGIAAGRGARSCSARRPVGSAGGRCSHWGD